VSIEFDPAKDEANIKRHGISLGRAADLEAATVEPDTRNDYGEPRFRAWGRIDGKAWCLAFTLRGGRIRAISLRRVSKAGVETVWTRLNSGGA
jgi:uncharacterized DUF497 family protein